MNNLALSSDAAQIRREYHKSWREKNKQRISEYRKNYWEKKALEKKLQSKSSGRNKHEA